MTLNVYPVCHYAEYLLCCVPLSLLSVVILRVVMLNVVKLNVVPRTKTSD